MTGFILSCSTCCFRNRGRDEIEETLTYAPQAGYSYIALGGPFTWEPGLIQWLDKKKFLEELSRNNLKLSEVWTPPIPTESLEKALIGAEQVAKSARVAIDLGCNILVQTGGSRREEGLQNTVTGLKRLLELISDLDIKICLEPHINSQILTFEDYDKIFSKIDSPKLGITIDTGHFHSAGVDFIALIKKYSNRIWNIHLKDHRGKQSVPIGEGEIDIPGLINELRRINYNGFLAVELEVIDSENAPKYVKDAYRYLAPLIKED